MISKIGYENKTALQNDEDVPETQKVTDQNMNEIKKVVNDNADELEEFQNSYKVVTEKEVSISPIQPLQNQTLWIQRGKNRFNKYGDFDFGIGSEPPVLQEDGTLLAVKSITSGYAKQQRLFLEKNTTYVVSGKVISINPDNPDVPKKLAVPLVLAYKEGNENVQKSARNIEGVKTSLVNTINVYDLLKYTNLVITLDTVKKLEEVYA